jgi:hypothetical protein
MLGSYRYAFTPFLNMSCTNLFKPKRDI